MKTVVFDLDGTLADTSGDLIAAANACFRGLGHGDVLDPERDKLTAFHGGRAMLTLGFERLGFFQEEWVNEQYQPLLGHYERNIDVHTRLYPGALDAMDALQSVGFRLSVCTNKPEGLARLLLGRLGLLERFGALVGADTLPVRKPDPAPFVASVEQAGGSVARSCLIGDTVTDVRTARAAGVPVVLVGFGPEGPGISRLEPDAMIDHFSELPDTVVKLLGD